MKKTPASTSPTAADSSKKRIPTAAKAIKIAAISLLCLICVICLGILFMFYYLDTEHTTRFFNQYASRYFRADIKAKEVNFTLLSSFPDFNLEIKGLEIISRRLDELPEADRKSLPEYADTMLTAASFTGAINPLELLKDNIDIKDIRLSGLRLNLVEANDTLSNYDILLPEQRQRPFRVPRFSIKSLNVSGPTPIKWISIPSQAKLELSLSKAFANRTTKKDSYLLDITGNADFSLYSKTIFRDFPFEFYGRVDIRFYPFKFRLDRYSVKLGNLSSRINLSMQIEEKTEINSLQYDVEPASIMTLLEYLPDEIMPGILRGIKSDISLSAKIRMTSPYIFTKGRLPSFDIDFRVPESYLNYDFGQAGAYSFHDIRLNGTLYFNGDKPEKSYVDLNTLQLSSDSAEIRAKAKILAIFDDPVFNVSAKGKADIGRLMRLTRKINQFYADGNIDFNAKFNFRLSDLTQRHISEIDVNGNAILSDFKYISPDNINIRGSKAGLSFNTDLRTHRNKDNAALSLYGYIDSLLLRSNNANTKIRGIRFSTITDASMPLKYKITTTVNASIAESECRLKDKVSRLSSSGIAIKGNLHKSADDAMNMAISANAQKLDFKNPHIKLHSDSLSLQTILRPENLRSTPRKASLTKILKRTHISGTIHSPKGYIRSAHYPADTRFNGLDISFSPDSIMLQNLNVRSQDNRIGIKGSLYNLSKFLTGDISRPLDIHAKVDIDTLNLNQIASVYRRGTRKNVLSSPDKNYPKKISDTTAFILPRNLRVGITAKAAATEYTNLHLSDLGTKVYLDDGILRIDSLHASASFGKAFADIIYDSRSIDSLALGLAIDFTKINIDTFFQKFRSLERMMPQIRNLHGDVSLKADGNMEIFPDMYINIPSVRARIEARGWDLDVHQSHFIREITKRLLIRNNNDIHIPDIHVHASIHDNLLELDPFIVCFDRYKLSFMGHNDFRGDLYYHIAVLDSPLPLRFGINVEGNFNDYRIRFGGPKYKAYKANEIIDLIEKKKINLTREVRIYLNELIDKAADAEKRQQ